MEYSQPEAGGRYAHSFRRPCGAAQCVRGDARSAARRDRGVGLQPSLFTRLAVAEAELRAVKDMLAEVLDVIAEVKANQDEMRQDHDERRRAERLHLTERRRPWRTRMRMEYSIVRRALLPIQAHLARMRTTFKVPIMPGLARNAEDELPLLKELRRIAITGLFLLMIIVIALYQLIDHR